MPLSWRLHIFKKELVHVRHWTWVTSLPNANYSTGISLAISEAICSTATEAFFMMKPVVALYYEKLQSSKRRIFIVFLFLSFSLFYFLRLSTALMRCRSFQDGTTFRLTFYDALGNFLTFGLPSQKNIRVSASEQHKENHKCYCEKETMRKKKRVTTRTVPAYFLEGFPGTRDKGS